MKKVFLEWVLPIGQNKFGELGYLVRDLSDGRFRHIIFIPQRNGQFKSYSLEGQYPIFAPKFLREIIERLEGAPDEPILKYLEGEWKAYQLDKGENKGG